MSPKPVVTPDLHQLELAHAREGRLEVADDVVGAVGVFFGVDPREQQASPLEGPPQVLDGLDRIGEVLEDVHRQDHVEAFLGQGRRFQVNEGSGHASSVETPATEVEKRRRDVAERHGNPRRCEEQRDDRPPIPESTSHSMVAVSVRIKRAAVSTRKGREFSGTSR